jgi:anthranilate synthase component 1
MEKLRVYSQEFIEDRETPITIYKKYVGEGLGLLLESKDKDKGRYSFISKNFYSELKYHQGAIIKNDLKINEDISFMNYLERELDRVEVINDNNLPFVGGAFGTIAYDIIREFEYLPDVNPCELDTPDSHLFFVREGVIIDHLHEKIIFMVVEEDSETGAERALEKIELIKNSVFRADDNSERVVRSTDKKKVKSNTTKEEYMEMVEKAKKYIYEGDIFQVVLSQRWQLESELDPFEVYRVLRATNPSPYLFYFNFGGYKVAGSSPEMLVELKNDRVKNCPIAGTRKRGKTAEEDRALAEDLLSDPKERAEHVMLVDLARNDMGRIAKVGTVEVTDFMSVANYSHVMHIVSLVEGDKKEDVKAFEVLGSFLPAGTLSGAPKIRAMEIIDELEKVKRGIYGGAVGYFSYDGNMDTCIAIRTMVIKDNKIHMQAGAGITAKSIPEMEYEECVNKVKVLIDALGGEI